MCVPNIPYIMWQVKTSFKIKYKKKTHLLILSICVNLKI